MKFVFHFLDGSIFETKLPINLVFADDQIDSLQFDESDGKVHVFFAGKRGGKCHV